MINQALEDSINQKREIAYADKSVRESAQFIHLSSLLTAEEKEYMLSKTLDTPEIQAFLVDAMLAPMRLAAKYNVEAHDPDGLLTRDPI